MKQLMLAICLVAFIMVAGCCGPTPPDFTYGQHVDVVDGFYKGYSGQVVGYTTRCGGATASFSVKLHDGPNIIIKVRPSDLEESGV